jgi:hypothetical protein
MDAVEERLAVPVALAFKYTDFNQGHGWSHFITSN